MTTLHPTIGGIMGLGLPELVIIVFILAGTFGILVGATFAVRRLTNETPPKFEKSVEKAFLQAMNKTSLNPQNQSSYALANRTSK